MYRLSTVLYVFIVPLILLVSCQQSTDIVAIQRLSEPSVSSVLTCSTGSKAIVVNAGQSATVSWNYSNPTASLQFSLPEFGTLANPSGLSVTYKSPTVITDPLSVQVFAFDPANSLIPQTACNVYVVPVGDIGIVDGGDSVGLKGKVYNVGPFCAGLSAHCTRNAWTGNPAYVPKGVLPDSALNRLTPFVTLVVGNLNIPNRVFSNGFPGVPITEWFQIDFQGTINIPTGGSYDFMLNADDGAQLFIDNDLIVDDDGIHSITAADGTMTLSAGTHAFRVIYYQGPRTYIGLQAYWKSSSQTAWSIIPASAFVTP